MAFGVERVEVDDVDLRRTCSIHLSDGCIAQRVAGQCREDDAGGCLAQVLLDDRQADLGGATEKQQGLGIADGVDHQWSSNLLDISEAKTLVGSTVRRTLSHSSIRGYIEWKVSASVRESFAV